MDKREKGRPTTFVDPIWMSAVLRVVFRKDGIISKIKMRQLMWHYVIVNGEDWARERILACYKKYL